MPRKTHPGRGSYQMPKSKPRRRRWTPNKDDERAWRRVFALAATMRQLRSTDQ